MLVLENTESVMKKLPIIHHLKEITVYNIFCSFSYYEYLYRVMTLCM